METISVYEAVRRATDPYGPDGLATSAARPAAYEVLRRLEAQGYTIVRLTTKHLLEGEPPLEGIEQYQVESR